MKFKTPYQPHARVVTHTPDEGLTEQHHKQKCDTAHIVKTHMKTGLVDHLNTAQPKYENVLSDIDFKSAMDLVARGTQTFEQLPANIRKQFNQNPAEFIQFAENPKNRDALVSLGLAVAPKPKPKPKTTPKEESPTATPPKAD